MTNNYQSFELAGVVAELKMAVSSLSGSMEATQRELSVLARQTAENVQNQVTTYQDLVALRDSHARNASFSLQKVNNVIDKLDTVATNLVAITTVLNDTVKQVDNNDARLRQIINQLRVKLDNLQTDVSAIKPKVGA